MTAYNEVRSVDKSQRSTFGAIAGAIKSIATDSESDFYKRQLEQISSDGTVLSRETPGLITALNTYGSSFKDLGDVSKEADCATAVEVLSKQTRAEASVKLTYKE